MKFNIVCIDCIVYTVIIEPGFLEFLESAENDSPVVLSALFFHEILLAILIF